jgi:predicted transcriptional regulator
LWQTLEALFENQIEIGEPDGTVSDLMARNVITVASQQTLHDVLERMKKNRVKRLVVVDDARRVIGMVTRSDLVRVFFDRFI